VEIIHRELGRGRQRWWGTLTRAKLQQHTESFSDNAFYT